MSSTTQDWINFCDKGLVPIHALIKSLRQAVEQQEWDGDPVCEGTKRELDHVVAYHLQTGSLYYPMF